MNLARSNREVENRELVLKVRDQTTLDESFAERSEGFPKPAAMKLLMGGSSWNWRGELQSC